MYEPTIPENRSAAARQIASAIRTYNASDLLASNVLTLSKALLDEQLIAPLQDAFSKDFEGRINLGWRFLNLPHPRDADPAWAQTVAKQSAWLAAHARNATVLAAVILRHSALDRLFLQLLEVSYWLRRDSVTKRASERKVRVADALSISRDDIARLVLREELVKLERESLSDKWKDFCALEAPMSDVNEQALYGKGELIEFDTLRRHAVHRLAVETGEERIRELMGLMSGIALVSPYRVLRNHEMKLPMDARTGTDDPFSLDSEWLARYV